jgi:hypothetical protein
MESKLGGHLLQRADTCSPEMSGKTPLESVSNSPTHSSGATIGTTKSKSSSNANITAKNKKRFNSISEKTIDSKTVNSLEPNHMKAFSLWRLKTQSSFKNRLSLKLIKKRDTFISRLEEDKKLYNK